MKLHPHDVALQELLDGLGLRDKEILQHILSCRSCLERSRTLFAPVRDAAPSKVVDLDRWTSAARSAQSAAPAAKLERLQSDFERERAAAVGHVAELLELAPARQRLLLLNQARFHTWAVCEQLLNHSQETNFSNPERGEQLAALAVDAVAYLDTALYGAERVEDLQARAWAHLGNSRRIQADFDGAEEAFRRAMEHLKEGTGEPMERAALLDLRASLYRAQRRFDEALRALRRAIAIFQEIGETHRAGRSLIGMALVLQIMGESERATPIWYQAVDLVDPSREPRLLFSLWYGLISNLAELGRFMEAHKVWGRARPALESFPERWAKNSRRWLEARLARGLGQRKRAEAQLLALRAELVEEGAAYDVALISLELASLYLEDGRHDEVRRISEEIYPFFSSRGIHREALAALTCWRDAVAAGRFEVELAGAVTTFLNRSRNDQTLRFQPPGAPAPASAGD